MSGFGSTPFGTSPSGDSGLVPPTSGGSGLLPFPTASSTSPFAASPSALFFGHPAPITSAVDTNTTMPGKILALNSWLPVASISITLIKWVGLVPIYSPNPYVSPQPAPTVGNQQGNEGVSSGIAAGFNPFIIPVSPPTTSTPNTFPSRFSNNNPPTSEGTPTPFQLFPPPRETTTEGTPSGFQFPTRTVTTTDGTPASFPFTPQTPACFPFPQKEAITEGTPAGFLFPPRTEARTGGLFPPCVNFPPQTETTTGGPLSCSSFPPRTEATIGGKPVCVPFTPQTSVTTVPFQDPTGWGTKSCECSKFGKTMMSHNPYEYPSIQRGGSRSSIFTPTSEEGGFGTIQSMSAMEEFKNKSHEELRFTDYQLGDKGGSFPPRSVTSSALFGR